LSKIVVTTIDQIKTQENNLHNILHKGQGASTLNHKF